MRISIVGSILSFLSILLKDLNENHHRFFFPLLGHVTRNSLCDAYSANLNRRKICAAVAVASIVTNGTGYVNSQKQVVDLTRLQTFLTHQQKERQSLAQCALLVERHEPDVELRSKRCMSMEGFANLLLDEENCACAPPTCDVSFQTIEMEFKDLNSVKLKVNGKMNLIKIEPPHALKDIDIISKNLI